MLSQELFSAYFLVISGLSTARFHSLWKTLLWSLPGIFPLTIITHGAILSLQLSRDQTAGRSEMSISKLNGVVIAVEQHGQTVETDSPQPHLKYINLHGWNRIQGEVSVGDKVELEYRTSDAYGLWWGKVVANG
jgi:hypothetical protein